MALVLLQHSSMTRFHATTSALVLVAALAAPARAADVHIGINITPPSYVYETPPPLVVVPGHPHVHYAPDVAVNFFSYGGRYYTYDGGNWFVAGGDRGHWNYVERRQVPSYVLNVPTRYYRVPPRNIGGGHWNGNHGKGRGKHWKHKGDHPHHH